MITKKQDIIKWIERLPGENFKTVVLMLEGEMLDGETVSSYKLEGLNGDICALLAGFALHNTDFREAFRFTFEYLRWKGVLNEQEGDQE